MHQWALRFDGRNNDLDAEDFVFRVERQAYLYGVSTRALVIGVGNLLTGRASQWYWTNQRVYQNATWEQWKKAFLRRFAPHKASDFEIRAKMEQRRQASNENFSDFCQDIEAMASRLGLLCYAAIWHYIFRMPCGESTSQQSMNYCFVVRSMKDCARRNSSKQGWGTKCGFTRFSSISTTMPNSDMGQWHQLKRLIWVTKWKKCRMGWTARICRYVGIARRLGIPSFSARHLNGPYFVFHVD